MSDELFQRSIKITTSLIEQMGEKTLQAACAKLSAQCGGDTSKVTQPARPERAANEYARSPCSEANQKSLF